QIALSSVAARSLGRALPDGATDMFSRIAFTSDGRLVAFGISSVGTNRKDEQTGVEGYTHTWNISNPTAPETHSWSDKGHSVIALSPDASVTASAKSAFGADPCWMSDIRLTRVDGTDMAKPLREGETACALAFSPDSHDLIIATCKVPPADSKGKARRYE